MNLESKSVMYLIVGISVCISTAVADDAAATFDVVVDVVLYILMVL